MPQSYVLHVVSKNGVPFEILFIPVGGTGPHPARSAAFGTMPRVEVFDLRYPMHGYHGQFVSSYYAQDLLNHPPGGIDLHGGEPNWRIDAPTMALICQWLRHLALRDVTLMVDVDMP